MWNENLHNNKFNITAKPTSNQEHLCAGAPLSRYNRTVCGVSYLRASFDNKEAAIQIAEMA